MNVEKNFQKSKRTRVLIAPLDWGLGHATRCIPIINALISQNVEVFIAADEKISALLKIEFPDIQFLTLPGYNVKYSKTRRTFTLKMCLEVPKIVKAILTEKRWLKRMIGQFGFDAVISDNRFGLSNSEIPCIYITHQLHIITGSNIIDESARIMNYYFLNKFSECWVPDDETDGLAGKLSHPDVKPAIPVKYMGPLTRFKKLEVEKDIDVLVLLSGPEPQRTIFEKIILSQLKNDDRQFVIVRGLPGNDSNLLQASTNVLIHEHLPSAELNNTIQRSKLVLARCGYSTVMDLTILDQKAILVPTPGQTEQEYLAAILKQNKIFYTTEQEKFDLYNSLEHAMKFETRKAEVLSRHELFIKNWLSELRKE